MTILARRKYILLLLHQLFCAEELYFIVTARRYSQDELKENCTALFISLIQVILN